nr:unnamed protein product [Callosobruchus analis]
MVLILAFNQQALNKLGVMLKGLCMGVIAVNGTPLNEMKDNPKSTRPSVSDSDPDRMDLKNVSNSEDVQVWRKIICENFQLTNESIEISPVDGIGRNENVQRVSENGSNVAHESTVKNFYGSNMPGAFTILSDTVVSGEQEGIVTYYINPLLKQSLMGAGTHTVSDHQINEHSQKGQDLAFEKNNDKEMASRSCAKMNDFGALNRDVAGISQSFKIPNNIDIPDKYKGISPEIAAISNKVHKGGIADGEETPMQRKMILPQNPAPTFDNYEETDTATMEFNDEEATVDISQQNNTVNSTYKKYSGYPFHETPTIPSSLPLKAGSSADIYESSTEQTSFGLATAGAEINTSSNTYKRNLPLCKVSPTIQPPKEIASNISPVDFNSSHSSTSQNNEIDDIIDELASSGSEYVPSTSVESSTTEEELDNDFKIVCSMDEQEDCLNIEKVIAPDVSNHKEEIQTYQPLSHVKSSTINSMEASNRYSRKPSARERPTICPICFEDVVTHFTRHLIRKHRNHKEVKILISLKPRSKERLELVSSLRKQGYFLLKTEKNINRPVKTSKKVDAEYFVCSHCLGQYKRELLYKHDKICKSKPRQANNLSKSCLTTSQTFMALIQSKNSNFLKSSRVKSEVFCIMRADAISAAVKNDSIICLYGEVLLSKHKRQQIVNVVSNKMREMGRLLIILKQSHTVECLFDALKPEMFQHLVTAVKTMSGYSESTKSFQSPSLAMHMGTNLKKLCVT